MKKVIIFGTGGYGLYALNSLDEIEYQVLCFVDNVKEFQGQTFYGYYVDAPENVFKYDFDYIILPVSAYAEQMRQQLSPPHDTQNLVPLDKFVEFHPNAKGVIWDELRIAMLRRCIEEIKENHVPGSMAELGVYQGDFAKFLNRCLPERRLYPFDTFSGFDSKDQTDKDVGLKSRSDWFSDGSEDLVLSKMSRKESCVIRKGYFPDTARGLERETYCFVSLDADLYKPILAGLEYFYPRLSPGGYIFVHDFVPLSFGPGVRDAVREYCSAHRISYVPMLDRQGSVVITK